jgi:hypothetical protein
VDLEIHTDTSKWGWGAHLLGNKARGVFSYPLRCVSSNQRELLAIFLKVKAFLSLLKGKSLQVKSDNVTSVAYVNLFGERFDSLYALAQELQSLCLAN